MAGRIKGITVEIGGDTTKLEQALKSVNSTIKTTQSQLKDVNKLLKLEHPESGRQAHPAGGYAGHGPWHWHSFFRILRIGGDRSWH